MLRLFISMFFVTSCAKESVSNYIGFEKYVAVFDEGSRLHHGPNRPAYIRFHDLGGLKQNIPGLCYGDTIYIDPAHWLDLDEMSRQVLILHELGHCVLGKKHSSGIMSEYLQHYTTSYWDVHKDSLIIQLFRRER